MEVVWCDYFQEYESVATAHSANQLFGPVSHFQFRFSWVWLRKKRTGNRRGRRDAAISGLFLFSEQVFTFV